MISLFCLGLETIEMYNVLKHMYICVMYIIHQSISHMYLCSSCAQMLKYELVRIDVGERMDFKVKAIWIHIPVLLVIFRHVKMHIH